jgi:hypothetical protein
MHHLECEEQAKNYPEYTTAGNLSDNVSPLLCGEGCQCIQGFVTTYYNLATGHMVCHEKPLVYDAEDLSELPPPPLIREASVTLEPNPEEPPTIQYAQHEPPTGRPHRTIELPPDYPRLGATTLEDGPGSIIAHQEDLKRKLEEAVDRSVAPDPQRGELRQMMLEYIDIFRQTGDRTHSCPMFEQSIPVNDDLPVVMKQYPLPHAAREALTD